MVRSPDTEEDEPLSLALIFPFAMVLEVVFRPPKDCLETEVFTPPYSG
jgi:hypothetical protein